MYKVKKSANPFYIESNQTFRQTFLVNLNKLSEASTKKTGLDEIRDLLANHVQDGERLNLVLTLVSENSDHQKATGKREVMKIIGLMAEVFEDKLSDFLPKIINIISKKLKENDPQIHDTLSASLGNLVSFTIRNLDLETAYKYLNSILSMLFQLGSKGNRYTQIGSAICIAKVIQSSPFEFLYVMVDEITVRLAELIKSHVCKAHIQLFECLISLILAFEGNGEKLQNSATNMLPLAIENLTNSDWNVRKIAVEVIYTLSVLVPEVIVPYKHELLDVLNHCRFDKIKNVRDVAITAITRLKELEDPENPAKLPQYQNDDNTYDENREINQYQTASFQKREEDGKWTSSNLKEHSSPTRKIPLKVNPEFFNNAPKNKGDIEIYTKSPPREFIIENDPFAKKDSPVKKIDPNVKIESSPNKTYKYTISTQNINEEEHVRASQNEFVSDFQEEKIANTSNSQRYTNNTKDLSSKKKEIESPRDLIKNQRERQENILKGAAKETPDKFNSGRKNYNIEQQYDRFSAEKGSKLSEEDVSNIFRQLNTLNEQQNKMMEQMANFQNSTLSELKYLKNRLKDVEDYVQKMQHTQKPAPAYPYQQPPYTYTPPPAYQPIIQPPQVHPTYPMQYSNYAPPSYYYPQGPAIGQNTGRFPDQNWVRKSHGDFLPSQGFPNSPQNANMSRQLRDRERYDRPAANEIKGNDRMQQEINRPVNRGDNERRNVEVRKETQVTEQPRVDRKEQYANTKSSKSKSMGVGERGRNSVGERLQDLLNRSQVGAAYELCLNEGDEETLLALMQETGVIPEYLESSIVENILTNLKSRVFDEAHRDMVLNWIEKALANNDEISKGTFIVLHEILVQLLEERSIVNGATTDKVKRIVNKIQETLESPVEGSGSKNVSPREDMENEVEDERTESEIKEIK